MNFKKFISGISALAIAASAFAGLAVTASATYQQTYSYNFSDSSNTFTWTASERVGSTDVYNDDETTATASGDKGVVTLRTGNNPGNVYSYRRWNYSSLVSGASSYTMSYKLYFNDTSDVRAVIGLVNAADRASTAKQSLATTNIIGSVGRFSNEKYIRLTANGNREFLTDGRDSNQWLQVTINVNVANSSYTYSVTGDATANESGTFENAPDCLEVCMYNPPNTAALIDIDDVVISYTAASTYSVSFTETNSLSPTVTVYSDAERTNEINDLTALTEGTTYYYTAALAGYETINDSFTLPATDQAADTYEVELTMEEETTTADTLTVVYKYGDTTVATVDASSAIPANTLIGTSLTYTSVNYVQDQSGNYYYVAADYTSDASWTTNNAKVNSALRKTIDSLEVDNTLTYSVTPVTVGEIVFYGEGEDINDSGMGNSWDSDWSPHTRWIASGDKIGGGYTNGKTIYTTAEAGNYQVTVVLKSGGRSTEIVSGETTILTNGNGSNTESGYVVVGSAYLASGAAIQIKGNGGSATVKSTDDIDYIVIRKLPDVTSATATAKFVKDYTAESDDGVATDENGASVWALTVSNTGNVAITSLGMKLGETTSENSATTNISGSGSAIFALVINKVQSEIESLTAILNGTAEASVTLQ